MTVNVKSLVGILAIGLVAFASCKKKSDDSAKAKLTGKWKLTKEAYDANSNGTMDASEVVPTSDSVSETITFNGDGSGSVGYTIMGVSGSLPFSWKLINSDKDIVVTSTQPGSTTATSDTSHIESLTSSDLEISGTDNSSGTAIKSWSFLHKQ